MSGGKLWPPRCGKSALPIWSRGCTLLRRKAAPERRRWQRLPLAIPVFVRGKEGNDREWLEFATALNVSAGGALVAVRRSLPLSSQVLLEIPSAPPVANADLPRFSRNLQGRVMWRNNAQGYQLAGVKFSRALLHASLAPQLSRRKVTSPK
ncbi:MAG TPA: PilZ domain-containing protein [Terriglobales bacterium]|nr:PilZ domain-containing protein [Terriglobales bacterium]